MKTEVVQVSLMLSDHPEGLKGQLSFDQCCQSTRRHALPSAKGKRQPLAYSVLWQHLMCYIHK